MKLTHFTKSILAASIAFSVTTIAVADDKLANINWSAVDSRGGAVQVPARDKPTVLVFARPEQPQSKEALEYVKSAAEKAGLQVIVIVSGETAGAAAKTLQSDGKYTWPIVEDPNFDASGKLGVHVWPTVLIVRSTGEQVAHLPGMPPTFPADLTNYLEFADGRIDPVTLQKRLTTRETVTDTDEQKAARHLQVARRLLDSADVRAASTEIESGLKLQPANCDLLVLRARMLVAQKQPKDALDALSKIPTDALPAWQPALVKSWALVNLEKWDDARATISDAIRLNPQPAEAHYLAGLIYTHFNDAPHAAESFRKAFEAGSDGRKLLAMDEAGSGK